MSNLNAVGAGAVSGAVAWVLTMLLTPLIGVPLGAMVCIALSHSASGQYGLETMGGVSVAVIIIASFLFGGLLSLLAIFAPVIGVGYTIRMQEAGEVGRDVESVKRRRGE